MANNQYRRILPGPLPRYRIEGDKNEAPLKKSRSSIRKACEPCRAKKVRCDGNVPLCGLCVRTGRKCEYRDDEDPDSLRRKLQDHEDIIKQLMTAPESEAMQILRSLRSTTDPSSALASAKGSMDNTYRPSDIQTNRAILPPTYSDLEFELTARHPIIYSPRATLEFNVGNMFQPTRLSLPVTPSSANAFGFPSEGFKHMPLLEPSDVERYSKLFVTAQETHFQSSSIGTWLFNYCDERLEQLRIGYWTQTPIDDELAARAISLYLEITHPLLTFFDADLFLSDLIDERPRFCSPFLVSALLSYACQSYSAVDTRAAELSVAFFDEAEAYWKAERTSDTLMNLAAIAVFSLSCYSIPNQVAVHQVREDMRSMGFRLKLFGTESDTSDARDMPAAYQRASAHTAHGVFNWLSLSAFYCPTEPLPSPPVIKTSWEDADKATDGASEAMWHPVPPIVAKTFPAICKMWAIIHGVLQLYFGGRPSLADLRSPATINFIESKYQQLLDWSDTLPSTFSRADHNSACAINMHILFHSIVANLFRPLVGSTSLLSFSSIDSSADAVLRATTNQLRRLLFACHQQNPRAFYSTIPFAAIVHIANDALRDAVALSSKASQADAEAQGLDSPSEPYADLAVESQDWRSAFLFCITSCGDMSACFPVAEPIGRSLLTMGIRDGVLSSQGVHAINETLRMWPTYHQSSSSYMAWGSFAVDLALFMQEPEAAQAKRIAGQFDELMLINEFTTGDYRPGNTT